MRGEEGSVFIVIAAYEEHGRIGGVVAGLHDFRGRIVVVDDGSRDDTGAEARRAGAFVLTHCVNRGQGAALETGIRWALERGADVIVTFDADGQHSPDDVPALVAPVLAGECDIALGSRFLGRAVDIPATRKWLLRGGVWFTRLTTRIRVSDVHNGLRALSRPAAGALRITLDRMAHASEIFDRIREHGFRIREVPVTVSYTAESLAKGQSSWGALRIAVQVLLEKLGR